MTLSSRFASLSARTFGAEPQDNTDFYDLEWMGGHYAINAFDGTTLLYGELNPESLAQVQTDPDLAFAPATGKTQKKRASLVTTLSALDLPLRPGMPLAEASEVCKPLFPAMLITKTRERGAQGSEPAHTSRIIAIVSDTLLTELHFANDEFSYLQITDLSLLPANDALHEVDEDMRDEERATAVAAVRTNPWTEVSRQLGCWAELENIEWSREFPMPSPEPEPDLDAWRQSMMAAVLPPALLSPQPAPASAPAVQSVESLSEPAAPKADLDKVDFDAMQRQMMQGLAVHMRNGMRVQYGSIVNFVAQSPAEKLLQGCRVWFDQSLVSMHPQPPSFLRMLTCLRECFDGAQDGLDSWVIYKFESFHDTLASLSIVGADELAGFLGDFIARITAEGCQFASEASRRAWLKAHFSRDDKKRFKTLAAQLPEIFRAWALARPDLLEQEDAAFNEATSKEELGVEQQMRANLQVLSQVINLAATGRQ